MKKRISEIIDLAGAILIALSVQKYIFHIVKICSMSEAIFPYVLV